MFGYQRRRDRARCAHAAGRSEGALAQADGFGGAGRCDLVAETLCRSIVAAKRNAEGKCGACRGERKLAAFSKPSRNYGTPIPSSGAPPDNRPCRSSTQPFSECHKLSLRGNRNWAAKKIGRAHV